VAQESSAATSADIFEKPVSRPIENPFGAESKVVEQPVAANPFGDTPAVRAPVVAQAAPAAVEAEPVQAAPVAVTPTPEAVAPAAPVVAQASALVEPEPIRTFEPVETKAVEAKPIETKPVEVTAPAAAAPSAPVALKDEALKPMLDSAGLVWVNTDADKLRAAREAAAQAEAPKQVVRERKRLPPLDAEPMQQVETGKDA
jgi:ribonuclease E